MNVEAIKQVSPAVKPTSKIPEKQFQDVMDQGVSKVSETLEDFDTSRSGHNIQFEQYDGSGKYLMKVVDSETEELIRQIPPQHMIDIQGKMGDYKGSIVDIVA